MKHRNTLPLQLIFSKLSCKMKWELL